MQSTLEQIVICQSKYDNKTIYFRVQSEDVFVSSTAQLSLTQQLKCETNLAISQKFPLRVQIWNYEPHKLLRQWRFQSPEITTMKNKHMISEKNWIIYLKKSDKKINNKQNKMLRSNKSRSTERLSSRFKLKVNDSKIKANKIKREQINLALQNKGKGNKDTIKKTLKDTIRYLIKQQSLINNFEHYGMDEPSAKAKTGKCTPASQQISNIKGYSAIFSEYGLNLTDLNNEQTKLEPFSLKLQLKKKIGKTR